MNWVSSFYSTGRVRTKDKQLAQYIIGILTKKNEKYSYIYVKEDDTHYIYRR